MELDIYFLYMALQITLIQSNVNINKFNNNII